MNQRKRTKIWDKSVGDENDGDGGGMIVEEDIEESLEPEDERDNLIEKHKQLQKLAIQQNETLLVSENDGSVPGS